MTVTYETPAHPDTVSQTSSACEVQHLMESISTVPFEAIAALALDRFEDVVEILDLDGKYRGKQFVAFNPTREDNNLGSFQINMETGGYKDFALNDFGGSDLIGLTAHVRNCSQTEAAQWLLAQLVKVGRTSEPSASIDHAPASKKVSNVVMLPMQPVSDNAPAFDGSQFVRNGVALEACYDYTTQQGALCFKVLRLKQPDGQKTFLPVKVAGDANGGLRWMAGMPEGTRPLYGLPTLNGSTGTTTILVTEGEKAALALAQFFPDSPVLTSVGGAQAAAKSDWTPLAGRDVVIYPDNDKAGQKYLADVTTLIRQADQATPIAVVNPERLLRSVCAMKDWDYSAKEGEFAGWDAADLAQVGLPREAAARLIEEATEPLEADPSDTGNGDQDEPGGVGDVRWESGKSYVLEGNVVMVQKSDGSGKKYWAKVCSCLRITRQLRDTEGAGWSIEIENRAPDGSLNVTVIAKSMLTDQQALKALLLDKGVLIYNWMELQDYLGHAIPQVTHRVVRQAGWTDSVYVQAAKTYGQAKEIIVLAPTAPACSGFRQLGTLSQWNADIGRYCIGNSRLILGVCVALAGPLLYLVRIENGGYHLVGASSIGKTTAEIVGSSVSGDPAELIGSWRATANSLEANAASRTDNSMFLDEMNQAAPKEVGDITYMLGNGQGKARMTRTASLATSFKWRSLFLSTGEVSLQQYVESAGQKIRAGMEVRLLNIPADAGKGLGMFEELGGMANSRSLADHLRQAARQTYGTAGDAWLTYLTQRIASDGMEAFAEGCRSRLAELEHGFAHSDADGQVHRAAKRFALLALAGEMATEAGVLAWPTDTAIAGIKTCYNAWIHERGGVGSSEEAQAIRQVQRFFEENGQSSFQRIDHTICAGEATLDEHRTVHHRAGYYRTPAWDETGEFYVLPEPFKNLVCAGLNSKLVAKVLRQKGLLLDDGSTTIRIPGLRNSIRAYRITDAIVGYDPANPPVSETPAT